MLLKGIINASPGALRIHVRLLPIRHAEEQERLVDRVDGAQYTLANHSFYRQEATVQRRL